MTPGTGTPNLLLHLIHGPVVGLASKCMDVSGGGIPNGTRVQIFDCNNTAAQDWDLPQR